MVTEKRNIGRLKFAKAAYYARLQPEEKVGKSLLQAKQLSPTVRQHIMTILLGAARKNPEVLTLGSACTGWVVAGQAASDKLKLTENKL